MDFYQLFTPLFSNDKEKNLGDAVPEPLQGISSLDPIFENRERGLQVKV